MVRIRRLNQSRRKSLSAGESVVGQTEMLCISSHSLDNSSTVDGDPSRALPDSILLEDRKR